MRVFALEGALFHRNWCFGRRRRRSIWAIYYAWRHSWSLVFIFNLIVTMSLLCIQIYVDKKGQRLRASFNRSRRRQTASRAAIGLAKTALVTLLRWFTTVLSMATCSWSARPMISWRTRLTWVRPRSLRYVPQFRLYNRSMMIRFSLMRTIINRHSRSGTKPNWTRSSSKSRRASSTTKRTSDTCCRK